MRHEVFTGPERRRRWSVEQKLAIVEEVGVNGWTVSDVARRHDVGRQNIYHWRRELRRILQADAYAGFNPLYAARPDGSSQFREAACWAHLRKRRLIPTLSG